VIEPSTHLWKTACGTGGMMATALPLAKVINAALEKIGPPRMWLAREAGISYSTLVDYLRRDNPKISIENLFSIMEVLGLDLTDFLDMPEAERRKYAAWMSIEREASPHLFARLRDLVGELEKRYGQ